MTDNSMTKRSGLGQSARFPTKLIFENRPGLIVIGKSGGFDNATATASGSRNSGFGPR